MKHCQFFKVPQAATCFWIEIDEIVQQLVQWIKKDVSSVRLPRVSQFFYRAWILCVN